MTDLNVGPLSAEEARIRNAADQAYRVLLGEDSPAGAQDRIFDLLRDATRRAPFRALAIAFVAGVIVARQR
jgi:hypothetical protein